MPPPNTLQQKRVPELRFLGFEALDARSMRARFDVVDEQRSFTAIADFFVDSGRIIDLQASDHDGYGSTGSPATDRAIEEAVRVEKIRAEAAEVWILHKAAQMGSGA